MYIATFISLINITLGLYVLSTILNETNVVLPNVLLIKLLYWKHFKGKMYLQSNLIALIPAVAEPTWIILAQVRESTSEGSNVLQTV
jgi:hypothetical protein